MILLKGSWLGIDIGSARAKVGSFCLIESDGAGGLIVSFEHGPAGDAYPSKNTKAALVDASRRPTYLQGEVESAIEQILDRSELVGRWFEQSKDRPSAVAIDAPVAFAVDQASRLTEQKSTDTFKTPDRATFEAQLSDKGDPFLRVNVFWKCVGMTIYRQLAARLEPRLVGATLETIAALTCACDSPMRRIRETFPSDVYKRANGYQHRKGAAGILSDEARDVLMCLVSPEWQGDGQGRRLPATQTMRRLRAIRDLLRHDLEAGVERMYEMRKRPGRVGDLWDAFTCAFACCCEDHDGAELHGWSDDPVDRRRLRAEGAILTVKRGRLS